MNEAVCPTCLGTLFYRRIYKGVEWYRVESMDFDGDNLESALVRGSTDSDEYDGIISETILCDKGHVLAEGKLESEGYITFT